MVCGEGSGSGVYSTEVMTTIDDESEGENSIHIQTYL